MLTVLARLEAQHLHGKEHVVEDGAPGQQHGLLKDEADVAKRLAHRLVANRDRPACGRREPRHELQQRALAASARADERHELVVLDVQGHVLDGAHEIAATRAVGLPDRVEPDHDRAGAAYRSNGNGVATAARHAAATYGASRAASARDSPEARCWRSAASCACA